MSEWFKERKEKKLHDPLTATAAIETNKLTVEQVEFDIDNDGGCKGSIINHGQRYATIGSTPRYLDWFFEFFYGESKENKKNLPNQANSADAKNRAAD